MKIVKVLWIDSCNSNMNWTVVEDIEVEPMYINSFGVVVKDTNEFLVIAQNYGNDPEQYSNITTIPKGCIKEVFVIHEDRVCENEQKFAWSEEDNLMEQHCHQMLALLRPNSSELTKDIIDNCHHWLKLLKYRVQPKQEWKQENTCDLTDFENTMMHIGESFFGKNAGLDPNDTNIIKEQANLLLELVPNKEWSEENEHWRQKAIDFMKHPDLIKAMPTLAKNTIDWLKSLKSQPKQKWSEEDKRTLQGIIGEIEANKYHAPDCDLATYDWFLSWLKSLKPQKQWKPNEEQLETFEYYLNADISNKDREVLFGLYKQLKQL